MDSLAEIILVRVIEFIVSVEIHVEELFVKKVGREVEHVGSQEALINLLDL